MTVYFSNRGAMDLDVVRLMGVSVKEGENPIGYFGTGLKYAISTILRNGLEIWIDIQGQRYELKTQEKVIRGKTFNVIMLNDEQLGFTTDLGKNWELWQAYRELHSNCIDEAGKITITPITGDTVISVKGAAFEEVFHERHKIFLHGEAKFVREGLEIYSGKSKHVYYRGVRVHDLPKEAMFTYNIISPMQLTEDRTATSAYDIAYRLESRIPAIPDKEFALKILESKGDWYDKELDFSLCGEPSDEFLDAFEQVSMDLTSNNKARELFNKHRGVKEKEFEEFILDVVQQADVEAACELVKHLGMIAKPSDFHYVENLGPNVLGAYRGGKMYITRQCLANGRDFTAITIYEEWVHKTFGYADHSRGMQQFLFDKILQLIKEKE